MIAHGLTLLAALTLLVLGAGAIASPTALSSGYGIPAAGAGGLAFVRATGVRDLLFGCVLGVLLATQAEPALRITVILAVLVALGDLAIVGAARGAARSLAVHASGALGFAVIWILLQRGL